ncbi:MAG: fibronectin type III domain-containing protein [Proteobacteria bacterium]|nr:fibronectin type III domain-containing protein [Pseudomonadota bacterium]
MSAIIHHPICLGFLLVWLLALYSCAPPPTDFRKIINQGEKDRGSAEDKTTEPKGEERPSQGDTTEPEPEITYESLDSSGHCSHADGLRDDSVPPEKTCFFLELTPVPSELTAEETEQQQPVEKFFVARVPSPEQSDSYSVVILQNPDNLLSESGYEYQFSEEDNPGDWQPLAIDGRTIILPNTQEDLSPEVIRYLSIRKINSTIDSLVDSSEPSPTVVNSLASAQFSVDSEGLLTLVQPPLSGTITSEETILTPTSETEPPAEVIVEQDQEEDLDSVVTIQPGDEELNDSPDDVELLDEQLPEIIHPAFAFSVRSGIGKITILWDEIMPTVHGDIIDLEYRLDTNTTWKSMGLVAPYDIQDIEKSRLYQVHLRVRYPQGVSEVSTFKIATLGDDYLEQFSSVTETVVFSIAPEANSVVVTWQGPRWFDASKVKDYQYRIMESNEDAWLSMGTSGTYAIENLEPNTTYEIELRILYHDGPGDKTVAPVTTSSSTTGGW